MVGGHNFVELRSGGVLTGYSFVCTHGHRDVDRPSFVCKRDIMLGADLTPEECRHRLLIWNHAGATLTGHFARRDHKKMGGQRLREYSNEFYPGS